MRRDTIWKSVGTSIYQPFGKALISKDAYALLFRLDQFALRFDHGALHDLRVTDVKGMFPMVLH